MPSACLDDATLDAFAGGSLVGPAREHAERHLGDCADCSELAAALLGSSGTVPRLVPGEPAPGDVVGRHRVVGVLGRGAQGVVLEAWDPLLDRAVALKIVRTAGHPEAVERLLAEARALARVAHPNVLAVYDAGRVAGDGAAGEHGADGVYVALERVRGRTLDRWLEQERPGWRAVTALLIQAARGVAAAHAAGVLHRDLKPENLLVGEDGRLRVSDFGLALAVGAAATDDSAAAAAATDAAEAAARAGGALTPRLTQTGALLGTPFYLAPERLDGEAATAATDQFALGVVAFEALAGARPFPATTLAGLRQQVQQGEPAAPLPRALPRALARAVLRALARDPARRHADVAAFAAALEGALGAPRRAALGALTAVAALALAGGAAALARPEPDACGGGEARRDAVWSVERRARVTAAFERAGMPPGGAVAALDAAAAAFPGEHRAVCEATHLRREQSPVLLDARMACLGRALAALDAVAAAAEGAPDALALGGALTAAERLPSPAGCTAQAAEAGDPPLALERAAVEALGVDIAAAAARGPALPVEQRLTEARALAGRAALLAHRPTRAAAALLLAGAERAAGGFEAAERAALDAATLAEAGRADALGADARLERLALAVERGALDAAAERGALAEAAAERLGAPPALLAELELWRGVAGTERGELDAAARHLERARQALERAGLGAGEGAARLLTARGNLARARGVWAEARALHEEALGLDAARLGAAHPALARHHHNLGGVLRRQGEPARAREHYQRALELERAGLGEAHPALALTRNSLALLHLDAGEVTAARALLALARPPLERAGHPALALVEHNLGTAAALDGDHAAALLHFAAALGRHRAALTPGHERVVAVLLARAQSERALGRLGAARATLTEAAPLATALRTPDGQALDAAVRAELAASTSAPVRGAPGPRAPSPAAGGRSGAVPSATSRAAPVPAPTPARFGPQGSTGYGAAPPRR